MTFVIKGLGMIGTSVGLALGGHGRRLGYDPDPGHAETARARGAVDEVLGAAEAPPGSVVFLCGPPQAILAELERPPDGAGLVLDVASVKGAIVRRAEAGEHPFVGGHPLAGCERSGPEAGRADMFRGRPFFLVPVRGREELVVRAEAVVRLLGAVPLRVDAERHDRMLARTSHLPYVLAHALLALAEDVGEEAKGPAFESLTRPGRSPWGLWRQILALNREAVVEAWRRLADEVEATLRADD